MATPEPGERPKPRWQQIVIAIGVATPVLGVIKTLAEAGSGQSLTLGDVTYYLGVVAVGTYFGLVPGFVIGALAGLAAEQTGASDEEQVALGFGGLAALGVGVWIAFASEYSDPSNLDSFGRFAVRVLGVAAVVGGAEAYRRYTTQS